MIRDSFDLGSGLVPVLVQIFAFSFAYDLVSVKFHIKFAKDDPIGILKEQKFGKKRVEHIFKVVPFGFYAEHIRRRYARKVYGLIEKSITRIAETFFQSIAAGFDHKVCRVIDHFIFFHET